MTTEDTLREKTNFIAEYAACLLGSGVHTSRVIRNSGRIAGSLGVGIKMTIFQKTMILTVVNENKTIRLTEVVDIPHLPISFEFNSELSSLSWEAYDKNLSLAEIKDRYMRIISKPKMNASLILLLVGLANASFCRLFGGNWPMVGVVFVSTLLGFFLRQQMQRRKINHFVIFVLSSFVASMCASTALFFDKTAGIAIATSVLYLIPGVPLINGVIDIVEGHTLTGCTRLIQAFLLVICIAVGLSASLLFFKNGLL